MEESGMTDKQFKAFLRLILMQLEKVDEKINKEEPAKSDLKQLIKTLQNSIEG